MRILLMVVMFLILAGCGGDITIQRGDNDLFSMDGLIALGARLLHFGFGLGLIWLSVKFHLFLMDRFKNEFFRDELVDMVARWRIPEGHPDHRKITLEDAIMVLSIAAYQGLVAFAILFVAASIQTPFG